MSTVPRVIWFWQRIVSPHMAGLAKALAGQGCEVIYVAEQMMSAERAKQGWIMPDLGETDLKIASSLQEVQALVLSAPPESIHICQGLRSNGLVGEAQKALAVRGLRQWVIMETVDDSGWRGAIKRFEYRRLFVQCRDGIQGVLATGMNTPNWVVARGMPAERVFPFAYFLPSTSDQPSQISERKDRFHVIFVGQFIERKRLDLLITALSVVGRTGVKLAVVGSGPLEAELCAMAEAELPGCVDWIGRLSMEQAAQEMGKADCLVLPSRHDGWGAVVAEALMAGTPVICSDRCGSAVAVQASGYGGVFRSGDVQSLVCELKHIIANGRLSVENCSALAKWAQCMELESGANYLKRIFAYVESNEVRPSAPWQT